LENLLTYQQEAGERTFPYLDILLGVILQESGINAEKRSGMFTDNGSCYISKEFMKFIEDDDMGYLKGVPYHPQTQDKIECYHRTMNNVVKLENYYLNVISISYL